MSNIKYFIGPMSKNVVDTIIEFCNETNNVIGLIPSRRQVEWNGGYVNNWITTDFISYVKSKTKNIIIQRDHSGPGQGQLEDEGFESLQTDSQGMDLIHVDPWKKYPNYTEGLNWTIKMIKYCYELNPNIEYEVGTEESIRRFEPWELNELIKDLYTYLPPEIFKKIKYLVIQSGTSLKGTNQTGTYDCDRLEKMIKVCKSHALLSKEHNGDYISVSTIKEKFELGLNAINIAPEFGLIETQTYLDEIGNSELFDEYWQICYDSKKWEKWVNSGFDPYINKKELIKICGHYVLSYNKFLSRIKSNFPTIDKKIKNNITKKLNELYGQ